MMKINIRVVTTLLMIPLFSQFSKAQRSNKDPRFIKEIQIQNVGASNKSSKIKSGVIATPTELCNKLYFKYAQLLNVEVEKLGDQQLLEFFEKWVNENGLNDHYRNARVQQFGFAGVMMLDVYKWSVPETMEQQVNTYTRINKDDLEFGDLIYFGKKGKPEKSAVYVANGQLVDLNDKHEMEVHDLSEKYYLKSFITGSRPSDAAASR